MRNLNRVTMIGQLAANPEMKTLSSGLACATFRLATNYSWKDENQEWKNGVSYHRVVVWEKLAEFVGKTFQKGDRVFLEGKLRTRSWAGPNGESHYATEVVARNVMSMAKAAAKQQSPEIAEEAEAVDHESWEKAEKEGVLVEG